MPTAVIDLRLDPAHPAGPVLSGGARYALAANGLPARVTTEAPLLISGTVRSSDPALCFSTDGLSVFATVVVGGNTVIRRYSVTTGEMLSSWTVALGGPYYRSLTRSVVPGRLIALTTHNPARIHELSEETGAVLREVITASAWGNAAQGDNPDRVWAGADEHDLTTGAVTRTFGAGSAPYIHARGNRALRQFASTHLQLRSLDDLSILATYQVTGNTTTWPGDGPTALWNSIHLDEDLQPMAWFRYGGFWVKWTGTAWRQYINGNPERGDGSGYFQAVNASIFDRMNGRVVFMTANDQGALVGSTRHAMRIVRTNTQAATWTWTPGVGATVREIIIPGALRHEQGAWGPWVRVTRKVGAAPAVEFAPGEKLAPFVVPEGVPLELRIEFLSPLGRDILPLPYVADPGGELGPRIWYDFPDADAPIPVSGIRGRLATPGAFRGRLA